MARASCIQNTGAPMSKSLTVPPPVPVMAAKKAKVTRFWRRRAAASAPEAAKTASPAMSAHASAGVMTSRGDGGMAPLSTLFSGGGAPEPSGRA